ncbi:MAG: ABC transporter ATP-binding protein [Acidimicrobiia bacterium]
MTTTLHTRLSGATPAVRIENLTRTFGAARSSLLALDGFSLDLAQGEFVCLVGASGCGKSTLLNIVAGLDQPTSGVVEIGGRRAALMFQEGALFPWLTARGNIELALKLRGEKNRRAREARAQELLQLVHMSDAGDRRPHQLSGGMRQRVSLARAFAQEADILLMDEPFGALDAMTRDVLHDELERIWNATGLTVLFVTHNVREAVRLGDRVLLLASRPGRVLAEYPIDIPRPRRIESPEVGAVATVITQALREEVRRHAH